MAEKILLVDDEIKLLEMVDRYLSSEGYQLVHAMTGPEALSIFEQDRFDLVVLDVMLPGLNGLEVCKRLREQSDVPIIMLTARSEEIDRLLGLELGADDYVTKPFSVRELSARIRAVLRRSRSSGRRGSPNPNIVQVGNLRLDLTRYDSVVEDQPVVLTPTEFKLLAALALSPGQVFSRLQLLERVYGEIYEGYERSIDTHMSNIRKKLESLSARVAIKTVYGVGYKLEEESL